MGDTTDTPTYELRPTEARWTHIALRVSDIDASIAWYQTFTPLELLDKRQDDMGFGAWLGQPDSAGEAVHPRARPVPAGHRSLQGATRRRSWPRSPTSASSCRAAPTSTRSPCAARRPGAWRCRRTQMPDPIGYICSLRDPDGNTVEFSFDQGVYAKAREVWGGDGG